MSASIRKLIQVVTIAVIIAALLLVGWGIGDAVSFFRSVPRAMFLPIMLIAMATAATSIQNPVQKGKRTPSGQRLLLALVQLITISLLVFLPHGDRREILVIQAEWIRWVGLLVAWFGYVVTIMAVRTLGKNYSMYVSIQDQHRLVETGIYGVVRNPIYLGNVISWSGACLVFRSWLVLPVFVFFLAFAVLRGAQEERLLKDEFGAAFEAYRRRTWRLIPHMY